MNSVDRDRLMLRAEAALVLQRRAARVELWAYCLYLDGDFFSRRPVLKTVAEAFERVARAYDEGRLRRLAVSLPPRAGKSYLTTVFITWMLGRHPLESVMRNT